MTNGLVFHLLINFFILYNNPSFLLGGNNSLLCKNILKDRGCECNSTFHEFQLYFRDGDAEARVAKKRISVLWDDTVCWVMFMFI